MVDLVVVGVGLIGSGALRAAADAGLEVVGIGPDEPAVFAAHEGAFASHYDSGRITRHLDPRFEWALLAQRAIAGYAALEARSGIGFHRPVGVRLAELDPVRITAITEVADRLGVPFQVTVGPEDEPCDLGLLRVEAGSTVLAEGAPAGHVDPRRMRAANVAVARDARATVLPQEVGAIEASGTGGWIVRTRDGSEVRASRVLLAAGPHADEVRGGLPLRTRAEAVVLATLDADEQARLAGLPAVLQRVRHPRYADCYLVPPTDYPDGTIRLKLGATSEPYRFLDTAEERRAWMRGEDHRAELDDLRGLTEALVPDIRATAWETKPCLITETASDLPLVDHLAPGLVVAVGGNGYAAKSANALGALAVDLAVEGDWTDPDLDAAAFALP